MEKVNLFFEYSILFQEIHLVLQFQLSEALLELFGNSDELDFFDAHRLAHISELYSSVSVER